MLIQGSIEGSTERLKARDSNAQLFPFVYRFKAMTVLCEITLYECAQARADQLAKEIYNSTKALENRYNFHAPGSWLSRELNNRNSNRVVCPEELVAVLQKVRTLSAKTNGLFDISVGTLTHAARENPLLSREVILQQFGGYMGVDTWSLDGSTLVFDHSQTRFDLGGVIKEYAVDKASQIAAKASGGSLVNYGGDLSVRGRKPDGDRIHIGIKNPRAPDQVLLVVGVEDVAVTTSGSYERSVDMGGVLCSHIQSCKKSTDAHVLSTTVIAGSALEAGVFATSLMLDSTLDLPADVQTIVVDNTMQVFSSIL